MTTADWGIVVTAFATVVLAILTFLLVKNLHDAHLHSIEPHVQWEGPRRTANPPGGGIAEISINARNVGAGAARLTRSTVESGLGETLSVRGLDVPSTLPSGVQYTFYVDYGNFLVALSHSDKGPVPITITLDYTDIENRYCYRSEVSVNLTQDLHGAAAGPIEFLRVDERPARKRRVPCP